MDYNKRLMERLCDELEKFSGKQSINDSDLETISMLSGSIKNLKKIMMMDSGEYSQAYSRDGDWEARGSYNQGSSYKRDSRGRYSRERGYSRDNARDRMLEEMESMMSSASGQDREILRHAMEQMEGNR